MSNFYMCIPIPFELKPKFTVLKNISTGKHIPQNKARKIKRQFSNRKRK